MNALRLLPLFLSFFMLAAHFYRAGQQVLALASVLILFLLLVKKSWVPYLMQAALVLGALEWLRSLMVLVHIRMEWGQSWERLAMILGGVALFTLLSALVFRLKSLKSRYSG